MSRCCQCRPGGYRPLPGSLLGGGAVQGGGGRGSVHQGCHLALRERGRPAVLGTVGAPAPQSCLVVKTCGASWAHGRWWGGSVSCRRHKHPTPGGGGGAAAKAALRVSWSPTGGQPTACTPALWWLKFVPTGAGGGGGEELRHWATPPPSGRIRRIALPNCWGFWDTWWLGARELCHKEWKMGTMAERIQLVSPANFLYNTVKIFANTGNALAPSRLQTPFGARHESTGLVCAGGVYFIKRKQNNASRSRS